MPRFVWVDASMYVRIRKDRCLYIHSLHRKRNLIDITVQYIEMKYEKSTILARLRSDSIRRVWFVGTGTDEYHTLMDCNPTKDREHHLFILLAKAQHQQTRSKLNKNKYR